MLGKPEKGRMVENMLLQMAQRGQIMSKLSENELIGILERVSEQMQSKTTVKVSDIVIMCYNRDIFLLMPEYTWFLYFIWRDPKVTQL